MKRWNFSGQPASHGNSKAHRALGSIGHAEFPGKVWKGKKMAGRMGNQNATIMNQRIVKIDTDRSLIYIKGNTPGAISGVVKIRDAVKKIDKQVWDLLYPTYVQGFEGHSEFSAKNQLWKGAENDPFEEDLHENDAVTGVDQDEEQ